MVTKSVLNLRAIYKLQEVFSRDIGIISLDQKRELDCIMMGMFSPHFHLVECQDLLTMDLLRMLLHTHLEVYFKRVDIQQGHMVLIMEIQVSLKQTHSLVLLYQE